MRGHDDGANSNFMQLMHLRAFDCPDVIAWMEKKTNKYTSGDIQNECLQVMALYILRQTGQTLQRMDFFNYGR